jgi:hypothetical protein
MKHALVALALLLPSVALAETAPTFEEKCTSTEASSTRGDDSHKTYVFEVENKCDFRIRCELNIAIYSAFGMNLGHKVLVIEPHAHESMVLKLKSFGGLTERDHRCKQI